MNKITSSFKVEMILSFRNIWFWIFTLVSLFVFYLAFNTMLIQYNPGGALTASGYLVQAGIFVFLILGLSLTRREHVTSSEDTFHSLPNGYVSKMIGKYLSMSVTVVLFSLLFLGTLFFFYIKHAVPAIFFEKATLYVLLYFTLSFWISGVLGMIIGQLIQSRIVYLVAIMIWIWIGPLNADILEILMALTRINLTEFLSQINLGQSNIHAMYDSVYGLPLETYRWLQKTVWIVLVSCLICMVTIKKNYTPYSRGLLVFLPILALIMIVPMVREMQKPQQVIKTNFETESVRRYDYLYYMAQPAPSLTSQPLFHINEYDITLVPDRILNANVELTVTPIESTERLTFTLYHDLRVQKIASMSGDMISFDQNGDRIEVTFPTKLVANQKVHLQMEYSGKSSPYFFANEQAMMLPSYFPWLPTAGSYPSMLINEQLLLRTPLSNNRPTDYTLRYDGPAHLYTNLPPAGKNQWKGTVSQGITLVAGMMTSKKIGATEVIYPVSLEPMLQHVPAYLTKMEDAIQELNANLGTPLNSIPKQFYFLSVPPESPKMTGDMWTFSDHMIVGIDQDYNELLEYETEPMIPLLTSVIRDKRTVHQNPFVIAVLADSYHYWYKYRTKSLTDQTEPPLKRDLRVFGDPKTNPNAATVHALIQFIDKNGHNEDLMNGFFMDLIERLHQPEILKFQDIERLLSTWEVH